MRYRERRERVAEGRTQAQIAEQLSVSEGTGRYDLLRADEPVDPARTRVDALSLTP